MKTLKECCVDADKLRDYMSEKGKNHKNYKAYMKMKYAQSAIDNGFFSLGNGKNWNDTQDRKQMKEAGMFARCLSYAALENVAMWMLYGDKGKGGAMINYPAKVIKNILATESAYLGYFENDGFVEVACIDKSEFEIKLSDVLYVDKPHEDRKNYRISHVDEHTFDKMGVYKQADIFYKSYPWNYERECRLLLRIKETVINSIAPDTWNKITDAVIKLSEADLEVLKNGNLFCSPIFKGECPKHFKQSELKSEVDWEI